MEEIKDYEIPSTFAYINKGTIDNIQSLNKKMYSPRKVADERIDTYLKNPLQYASALQDLSLITIINNGILKEFINYKSLILTNDHYLYTSKAYEYKDKEKLLEDEIEVAKYLDKLGIKNVLSWLTKKMFISGEVFLYKKETKDGVFFQELPSKMCKTFLIDEFGLYRFGVNMSLMDDEIVEYYPDEIKKAYKKYKVSKNKKSLKSFSNEYYIVGDSGCAFKFNHWETTGLPYYTHLFAALNNLSSNIALDNLDKALDNFKLIHQEVPMDKDGRIQMKNDVVSVYHEAIKSVMPEGIGVVTSPLQVKSITLGDGRMKNYDYTEKLKKDVYDNAGLSAELFNGNNKTKEAILMGSVVDTLVPLEIQRQFERYINVELMLTFPNKGWHISFLPTTYANRAEQIKLERENLSIYGSKKRYLASQGMSPLEAISIIYEEHLLNLQEYMRPMQTSHTISGTIDSSTPQEDEESVDNEDEIIEENIDEGGEEDVHKELQ